jgi:hypothetical protein
MRGWRELDRETERYVCVCVCVSLHAAALWRWLGRIQTLFSAVDFVCYLLVIPRQGVRVLTVRKTGHGGGPCVIFSRIDTGKERNKPF